MTEVEYNNPIGVAVALIPIKHDGEVYLLGVQRGIEPAKGGIALPGGYIDEFETAKIAAAREVMEETGLIVQSDHLPLYDEAITKTNRHLIFVKHDKILYKEDINLDFTTKETLKVVLIDRNTEICFPTHKEMIDKFYNKSGK